MRSLGSPALAGLPDGACEPLRGLENRLTSMSFSSGQIPGENRCVEALAR